MRQDHEPRAARAVLNTIGKITANSVAAYLAGWFYQQGLEHGSKVPASRLRKIAADRVGEAMGNLLARPDREETRVR